MQTQILSTTHPDAVAAALAVLSGGGLVAFPTDTVYGLAASLTVPAAIDRLYEAKSRSASKAIALLIAELDQLSLLAASLTSSAQREIRQITAGLAGGNLTGSC